MDIYIEHIVKKSKSFKEGIYTAGILFAVLIIFVYIAPFIASFLPAASYVVSFIYVGTVYGAYYLITSLNTEYEYILTNHELDVDKIMARRKRKRVISLDCKEFEIVAPANVGDFIEPYKNLKMIDVSGSRLKRNCYFAVLPKNGERVCLLFEPTEAMLRGLRTFLASKVIIDDEI